jgi:hypothetical protein
MKELKNYNSEKGFSEKSDNDAIDKIVEESGVSANEVTTATGGVNIGDEFGITSLKKVEGSDLDDLQFTPCTFHTDNGKQLGTKHFASVIGMPENFPKIGRTAKENATFLHACMVTGLRFRCLNVTSTEVKREGRKPYFRKTIMLQAVNPTIENDSEDTEEAPKNAKKSA